MTSKRNTAVKVNVKSDLLYILIPSPLAPPSEHDRAITLEQLKV